MKILALTDLHGQRSILVKLDKHLDKNDYNSVIMLGDLCNRHDVNALQYARDFIDIIKKHRLSLFAIHGNQEPDVVRLLYQQENISVHFNPKPILTSDVRKTVEVVGVGYGDIFPTDPDFAKGKILLTHEPPRAKTILQMKELKNIPNAPLIHFSGHLHSMAIIHKLANASLGQVLIVMSNRAAVLQLPQFKVKFISF